ncbi:MAG: hypothetical protein AAGA92_07910 [Planctomycetota bacterium]
MARFLIVAVLIACTSLTAEAGPAKKVVWQADYGKALEATRNDDRPLLVVLEMPAEEKAVEKAEEPSEAAEAVDATVDHVEADLLKQYQLCRIDATTEYGQRVAKAFGAQQFPFSAIIDKTGSIILHKKAGETTDEEWDATLAKFKTGESDTAVTQTAFYRGGSASVSSPSYCPSCQRNAQQ